MAQLIKIYYKDNLKTTITRRMLIAMKDQFTGGIRSFDGIASIAGYSLKCYIKNSTKWNIWYHKVTTGSIFMPWYKPYSLLTLIVIQFLFDLGLILHINWFRDLAICFTSSRTSLRHGLCLDGLVNFLVLSSWPPS